MEGARTNEEDTVEGRDMNAEMDSEDWVTNGVGADGARVVELDEGHGPAEAALETVPSENACLARDGESTPGTEQVISPSCSSEG